MDWCLLAKIVTWANIDPDLCCHVSSLGHTVLIKEQSKSYGASIYHNIQWYNNDVHTQCNAVLNPLEIYMVTLKLSTLRLEFRFYLFYLWIMLINNINFSYKCVLTKLKYKNTCELKWSGAWNTGTVHRLSGSERGQYHWIRSAWFDFHSSQTWYSGLLRTILMAHQCWHHPKHSNQARMG